MPTASTAVEVTAPQAWFLAEHLHAGTFPWKLAITAPYVDPRERDRFNAGCVEELTGLGVLDEQGRVHPAVAESIRTVCQARQWLEWVTVIDADRILRGVLARTPASPAAVVALRYAQMVTFTPMQIDYSESLIPVLTAGLDDQPPADFNEFTLPMDLGAAIDKRIAAGADVAETLAAFDIPEREAQIMELARHGERSWVEITAHEATATGSRHQTDVCVNLINSEVGRILVHPADPDAPRAAGESVFAPAEPFAVAVALRDLTARLPTPWFPDEHFDI